MVFLSFYLYLYIKRLTSGNDLTEPEQNQEDSVDSSNDGSTNDKSSPKLHGNVIKTTVTSVSSHLAVIAKTYTKRHSSSHLST